MRHKRLISIILSVVVILALISGCGARSGQGGEDAHGGGAADSEESAADDGGDETGGDGGDNGADGEAAHGNDTAEASYILNTNGGEIIYEVDADGNKLAEYDLRELRDRVNNGDYDCDPYDFFGACDGVLYFIDYVRLSDGNYTDMVYAADYETGDVGRLWTGQSSSESVRCAEIYDGSCYISVQNGNKLSETRYERRQGMSFTASRSEYEKLFDAAGEREWQLYTMVDEYRRGCYSEVLDTLGFILFDAGEGFALAYTDGGVRELPQFEGYVRAYDANGIVFDNTDYESLEVSYYYYDITDETTTRICSATDTNGFLAYSDGVVYYYVEETDSEYGRPIKDVYAYDTASGRTEQLYTDEAVPGAGAVEWLTGKFELIGGDIYTTAVIDDTLCWAKPSYNGGKTTFNDIGCPVQEISPLHHGSVVYRTVERDCPYCGTPLYKAYDECFVLDESASEYAANINAAMREGFDNWFDSAALIDISDYDPADCEFHLEYPTSNLETVEDYVSDVAIIYDRYLTVGKGGYWYGGGAHGYPDRAQYVFDLATGGRVYLADIIGIGNEEFKELVAQKTVEDFNSYEYGYAPYFAETAEEVYAQAYENADLETTYWELHSDGLYIIYFPYEMGAYASGFIEVKLFDSII